MRWRAVDDEVQLKSCRFRANLAESGPMLLEFQCRANALVNTSNPLANSGPTLVDVAPKSVKSGPYLLESGSMSIDGDPNLAGFRPISTEPG